MAENTEEQAPNPIAAIPYWVKLITTYLPSVVILALGYGNYRQFMIMREVYEARIHDKDEQGAFWRDAFTRTSNAYQKRKSDDSDSEDSSSSRYIPPPR